MIYLCSLGDNCLNKKKIILRNKVEHELACSYETKGKIICVLIGILLLVAFIPAFL